MEIIEWGEIPGVVRARLRAHRDERGSFVETWRAAWFPGMVQANRSESGPHVLRGIHLHFKQSDLWRLESGSAVALLADLRGCPEHPVLHQLDMDPGELLLIPPGVGHGYVAGEAGAVVQYLVTREYDPADELGVLWSDLCPSAWGWDPVVSARDSALPRWADLPGDHRATLALLSPVALADPV